MSPFLDTDLSWRARGLLAFCLDCKKRITRQLLIESGDMGIHSIIKSLRELQKAGYAKREMRFAGGKLQGQQWYFRASKFPNVVTKHVTKHKRRRYKKCNDTKSVTTPHVVTKTRTTAPCNNVTTQHAQPDLFNESSK